MFFSVCILVFDASWPRVLFNSAMILLLMILNQRKMIQFQIMLKVKEMILLLMMVQIQMLLMHLLQILEILVVEMMIHLIMQKEKEMTQMEILRELMFNLMLVVMMLLMVIRLLVGILVETMMVMKTHLIIPMANLVKMILEKAKEIILKTILEEIKMLGQALNFSKRIKIYSQTYLQKLLNSRKQN